ncbi:hypothetical protein Kpol_1018p37 [Vanderwaltozyma polyspora DSM 70294]|uniref:THIF-type NAD/FAD binding fold domain-containing protein n=1 Tax=Vanderwaltozyma polyspora (strain ATCC 22028 / DSM 70294 / BCRC 21397 / CBS 2163 / NBRC 10782 / NRRL Y-8283 / UCD 57-17) TaxID=436907 RepID=A7TDN8_VANPO|nr:uncharacterized protein Kpol_1018p37 [Vanderwaltozyma polyspora DSM 70294]EDO19508.1 hypothetical protein Kpol_1018p37 [Vanderwaltozyma polyspora DSM 70294]
MSKDTWKIISATAILSIAFTKGIELAWNYLKLNSNNASTNVKKLTNGTKKSYDDDLFREQLARNYAFLGEEGMQKLKDQYIVVVGAGGVGSWVVTMLVRSGCQKIRVIDFDQVSLSSLNRHSCANLKDVGTPKVNCLKNHLLEIAPWCEIDAINELWTLENAERLIFSNGRPTIVIDCIDNIDTKVDLLEYLYINKIEMISSGGASTKSDPTRMNVADITVTEEDPLARSVRRRLKKRGINTGIPVVFSAEKPDPRKAKLLPLPDNEYEKGKVDELSVLKDFRVRILPVLGTMPGIFGLTIATWVLTKVSGYPMEPIEGKNRIKIYDGIYQTLAGQMTRINMPDQRVPIALREVPYIVEEVFRGKSPISGFSTRLTLSKWDPEQPVSLQNVVLMTKEEQQEHEKRVLNGNEKLIEVYSKEALDMVEKRFSEERYYSQFR